MEFVILVSTFPNKKSAINIAYKSVKDNLAACINIIKTLSIYSWEGRINDCSEYIVFFKTTKKNKSILKNIIKENHTYDIPEIIELNAFSLTKKYSDWLVQQTLNSYGKP